VSLGGKITLGLSTTDGSTRKAYTVSPAADGTTQNFTIDGVSSSLSVSYADVFINGKILLTSTFSLSGNVLSLNTAPTSGAKIRVAFSSPNDNRIQYTLTASSSTVFTFPSSLPEGTYVDIYDGNGKFQYPGTTGYYLDITNGSYSVVFASAPVTPVIAVFDPSVNSGRQAYSLVAQTGSTTVFNISGGAPSTGYVDVFANGLFQMDGSSYDYTLSYLSGNWTVTFATAPGSVSLAAVFAPSTVLPSAQTGGNTVNQIVAGTNVTISPSSGIGIVTVNSSGGGSGTITGVTAGTGLSGGGTSGNVTLSLSTPVSVTNGGTGVSTPSLVPGSNVTISGSWPNQTVAASGGGFPSSTTFTLGSGTLAPQGSIGFGTSGIAGVTATTPLCANFVGANSNLPTGSSALVSLAVLYRTDVGGIAVVIHNASTTYTWTYTNLEVLVSAWV
jgi:hypothetical protein